MQAKLIDGALKTRKQIVGDAMKKLNKVYAISLDTVMNVSMLNELRKKAFSRIPITFGEDSRNSFIGILHLKNLVGLELTDKKLGSLISEKKI